MDVVKSYPAVADGLAGVYFARHRMQPPGGLPVTLVTGRAAGSICAAIRARLFVSEGRVGHRVEWAGWVE